MLDDITTLTTDPQALERTTEEEGTHKAAYQNQDNQFMMPRNVG